MNRSSKMICLHAILVLTLALAFTAAGQNLDRTPDPGQTDAALLAIDAEEVMDAVVDAMATCAVPGSEFLGLVEQPAMEFMMGPGECAYDVGCAETCNGYSFTCVMNCAGVVGSPPWLACKNVCITQMEECLENMGCCL